MSKRRPIAYKKSKKLFKRTAQKIHPKNAIKPMRGGIRF